MRKAAEILEKRRGSELRLEEEALWSRDSPGMDLR